MFKIPLRTFTYPHFPGTDYRVMNTVSILSLLPDGRVEKVSPPERQTYCYSLI